MKTIIVDSNEVAMNSLAHLLGDISDIQLVGQFGNPLDALAFIWSNPVELAFLNVGPQEGDTFKLVEKLREIRKDMVISCTSEYSRYISAANKLGVDYYLMKPYTKKAIELAMERIRLIAHRLHKDIYVQISGDFTVFKDGDPIPLTGKAKEILALVVGHKGMAISNREIYTILWEGREYSNDHMKVYYNALRRLKSILHKAGCEEILISSKYKQMINTAVFDYDDYA